MWPEHGLLPLTVGPCGTDLWAGSASFIYRSQVHLARPLSLPVPLVRGGGCGLGWRGEAACCAGNRASSACRQNDARSLRWRMVWRTAGVRRTLSPLAHGVVDCWGHGAELPCRGPFGLHVVSRRCPPLVSACCAAPD